MNVFTICRKVKSVSILNRYTFILIALLFIYICFTPFLSCRCNTTNSRRNIAKELQEIHHELFGLSVKNKGPSSKLLVRMEEIIHRLDKRIPVGKSKTKPVSKEGQTLQLNVCPEVYKGSKFGYPYYAKGWKIVNCTNARPIHSVVTILINAVAYLLRDFVRLKYILNGINKAYPTVTIYLAVQSREGIENLKTYKNLNVLEYTNSAKLSQGKIWNFLVSKASTPFVLIARDIVHFSWLSQLERQIRMISEIPNVGIAGGSYRNLSGHWKVGCYQSSLKNYVLEYEEGYFHSKNECMYCDYLQGPFVAKKSLLKFDENLSDEVVFEDLFLQITTKETLIMACPDAMYFTTDYYSDLKKKEAQLWQAFAKKWVLNRIYLPGRIKHSFSCSDIDFKCKKELTRSYLLPVCCQEQYAKTMAFLQVFCNQQNISFEIDTGSVLGTVKFNGLLPWDLDGDVSMPSSFLKTFGEKETIQYFKKQGYILDNYETPIFDSASGSYTSKGYVKLRFSEFYIEIWGAPKLTNSQFLPNDLKKRPTLSQVRESWITTVFSPGLFARNRYGIEILKHSQSWIITGMKNSFSNYSSGSFPGCENPEHHSCLHDFPGDGNLPFLVA